MCVVCRGRFPQKDLIRLQCFDNDLIYFRGEGRSFYICNNCIDNKRLVKYISKLCKTSKEDAKEKLEKIKKEYT